MKFSNDQKDNKKSPISKGVFTLARAILSLQKKENTKKLQL
jgi:hypothetical protein